MREALEQNVTKRAGEEQIESRDERPTLFYMIEHDTARSVVWNNIRNDWTNIPARLFSTFTCHLGAFV